MAKSPDAFVYNATLERIVDGDTFDCSLDLGFDVKLHKQRVRLAGIDTPESRTRDLAEKKLGLAAKSRLQELCIGSIKVKSLGKGKYGRILGIPYTEDGRDICQVLIKEGHAVEYDGGKKKLLMESAVTLIQEVGFPIAAALGLGWFIYKLIMRIVDGMETKLDTVDEKVESQIAAIEERLGTKLDSQHGILVALIDRVRSLDNEIIRQDTLIKTILGVPQLIDSNKIAKADRDDQRKD